MQENGGGSEEQTESEGGRRGMFSRAKSVIGSAKQNVSRSVDVMTGAYIRRFDEFTDATTRVVVGVHQDLSELREQVERLTERIDQLEQSIRRRTSLTPWIVGTAAVALLLSAVAVLMSAS